MNNKLAAAIAVAAFGLFAGSANAATSPATATFQVLMKINKACTVTAGSGSNIQIGPVGGVDANSGSNSGNNSISVTCSKTTPYFIGLAPSNASTAGAGVMSGTGGNTDKVPYQLNSVSAVGPIWGNTATSTTVGNGVSGVGTGLAQSIPVFATAPNANFTPDSYADTVTVNVNF
ncbi:MAG: spore coat protein U domain-containing protein [Rudaea sp.]